MHNTEKSQLPAESDERQPPRGLRRLPIWLRGALGGLLAGLLNGLLGAGGGMVAVPMLEGSGQEPTRAHATSIAVIVPICVLSGAFYVWGGNVRLTDALPFLPGGLLGAFLGAKLLPKIPGTVLRRVFGLFLLWASWRLLSGGSK